LQTAFHGQLLTSKDQVRYIRKSCGSFGVDNIVASKTAPVEKDSSDGKLHQQATRTVARVDFRSTPNGSFSGFPPTPRERGDVLWIMTETYYEEVHGLKTMHWRLLVIGSWSNTTNQELCESESLFQHVREWRKRLSTSNDNQQRKKWSQVWLVIDPVEDIEFGIQERFKYLHSGRRPWETRFIATASAPSTTDYCVSGRKGAHLNYWITHHTT
jgi:hypothetical protein